MRLIGKLLLIASLPIFITGCRNSNEAIEGKVKITSTAAFGNIKSMKSPPPQTPGQ
ncbi:MAG TPA: hypothetical protein PLN21_10400 [Gemmatales bacterium]|nr:hypothetical protein [Gemmatales bacterium]